MAWLCRSILRKFCPVATKQVTYFFFYKNTINFSKPQIFLNSKPLFDDFPAIPTPNYMLKMLLLICPFRLRTLFPQKTNISHFFEKSSTKSQPRYSYKLDSYKKKECTGIDKIYQIINQPFYIRHLANLYSSPTRKFLGPNHLSRLIQSVWTAVSEQLCAICLQLFGTLENGMPWTLI